MEWSIKDKEGWCLMTVKGLGFTIEARSLELILNAYDLAQKKKGEVDLRDITELKFSVNGMFGLDMEGNPIK